MPASKMAPPTPKMAPGRSAALRRLRWRPSGPARTEMAPAGRGGEAVPGAKMAAARCSWRRPCPRWRRGRRRGCLPPAPVMAARRRLAHVRGSMARQGAERAQGGPARRGNGGGGRGAMGRGRGTRRGRGGPPPPHLPRPAGRGPRVRARPRPPVGAGPAAAPGPGRRCRRRGAGSPPLPRPAGSAALPRGAAPRACHPPSGLRLAPPAPACHSPCCRSGPVTFQGGSPRCRPPAKPDTPVSLPDWGAPGGGGRTRSKRGGTQRCDWGGGGTWG